MNAPIVDPSDLCVHCAVFANDYFIEDVDSRTHRHQVPYNRMDMLPDFPGLTKSGEDGCKLCILIKTKLSSKIKVWKEMWRKDSRGLVSREVHLRGLIQCFHTGENMVQPYIAVGIMVRVENINHDHISAYFEVYRNTYDPGDMNPPFMYLRAGPTLCSDSISTMHRWLKHCDAEHVTCEKNRKSNGMIQSLPTRLICILPEKIRLVETKYLSQAETQATRYMALSHCWGPPTEIQYKTTSHNLQARLCTIKLNEMPRNFKDAILVGQSLGLEYIWIDSICIVQDMPSDLESEMMVMLEVYANSYITISATSAASADDGFLNHGRGIEPSLVIRRQTDLKALSDNNNINLFVDKDAPDLSDLPKIWSKELQRSPWNHRAWTLQESLVSPRIIHFAKSNIFFECSTLDCFDGSGYSRFTFQGYSGRDDLKKNLSECRSVSFFRQRHNDRFPDSQDMQLVDEQTKLYESESIYQQYYHLVKVFQCRNLSFIEDKFRAFSSIITATSRLTHSFIRHGVLMDDLRRGLYWHTFYIIPEPPLERWPTWSWLSCANKSITFPKGAGSPLQEKFISEHALGNSTTESSQVPDFKSTANADWRLCLKGLLIREFILRQDRIYINDLAVGKVFLDNEFHVPLLSLPFHLFTFKLTQPRKNDLDSQGLVLLPDYMGSFRRVGVFRIGDLFTDNSWVWDNVPETQITLI